MVTEVVLRKIKFFVTFFKILRQKSESKKFNFKKITVMDYELQVVLERVITFGSIFGILFIFLRNQHKQRMLMIEKGVFEVKKNDFNTKRGLMMAILLLFAVMGTIAGWILFNTIALFEGSPIFVVLPFGFVAVGYLVYYYYFVFKQEKKQD